MMVLTKLTDMAESDMHFIEMWAQAFAAVGTVGALIAALIVFRHEYVERRRGDVRGVQAWVDVGDNEGSPSLTGYVKNTSPEAIYDVKYGFRPIAAVGGDIRGAAEYLLPDKESSTPFGGASRRRTAFEFPRLDVVFTDSRGTRWNRMPSGVLRVLKPFSRPWRVPHELDVVELPWWAVRAHWHYRWTTTRDRQSFGLPPRWWAVDVRWARWRYAQEQDRISIPPWKVASRWRHRHAIAYARIRQDLPLPFWIVDYRFRRKHELRARARAVKAMHKANADGSAQTGG